MVASPKLLHELREVLGRPKFRRYLSLDDATEYIDGLVVIAQHLDDPQNLQRSHATRLMTTSSP